MYFFIIALLTIATAASLITSKTLLGYTNVNSVWKILLFFVLWISWMSPAILNMAKRQPILEGKLYNMLSFVGYGLFGFVFILFMVIFCRDILWYFIYGMSKVADKDSAVFNPSNSSVLNKANLITIVFVFLISVYSIYQGIKTPIVKEITITTNKIQKEIRIVQMNDMHMERSKPVKWFENIVALSNSLNPDMVVMPGDIVDDNVEHIKKHMDTLIKLKSKYGTYFSVGNHEFYNGLFVTLPQLQDRGIKILSAMGLDIADTNIHLVGIPDVPAPDEEVPYLERLILLDKSKYNLLLSHKPHFAEEYIKFGFDLQLSAHTHGGQLFPFHIPTKIINNYLSGLYEFGDGKLYISRGAGYWGPPMRLLAPSDITLITIKPE
jgi:predicted MPP superfamily phosphohydrolase